jgi:predicted amidohydrolase
LGLLAQSTAVAGYDWPLNAAAEAGVDGLAAWLGAVVGAGVAAAPHAETAIAVLAASAANRADHLGRWNMLATPPHGPDPVDRDVPNPAAGHFDAHHEKPVAASAAKTSTARLPTSPPILALGRYARSVHGLRIGLAQIAPRLGDLEANLERHHALIADARRQDVGLVVFPELGLTGYLLQDLASEVAMRLDDPRLTELARATDGISAVVGFVEESADHRLFIAAALMEDGLIRHVHRKLFLPTYGLFDERRFFAAGDILRAVPSRLGVGIGLAICEDFWHLSVPQVLALDGAQIIIDISSSPGRDLAATNAVGLGTATSWRTLMRTYAQLTTSLIVFVNRVGNEESVSFWGGSEVIAPSGRPVFSAPLYDEGLFVVDVDLADIRRERIGLPLLRDERLELEVRELQRIVSERAGFARDSAAADDAEPGLDVAPGVLAGGPDPAIAGSLR